MNVCMCQIIGCETDYLLALLCLGYGNMFASTLPSLSELLSESLLPE